MIFIPKLELKFDYFTRLTPTEYASEVWNDKKPGTYLNEDPITHDYIIYIVYGDTNWTSYALPHFLIKEIKGSIPPTLSSQQVPSIGVSETTLLRAIAIAQKPELILNIEDSK